MNALNRKELAMLIHEYNLACKITVPPKETCKDCFIIAGQILIVIGMGITKEGVSRLDTDEKKKK